MEALAEAPEEQVGLFNKYNFDDNDKERLYRMATVIRDADALDRTRFCLFSEENNLKAEFLVNDVSKKIIESCQRLNYIIYQDYINEKMLSGSVAFGKWGFKNGRKEKRRDWFI